MAMCYPFNVLELKLNYIILYVGSWWWPRDATIKAYKNKKSCALHTASQYKNIK